MDEETINDDLCCASFSKEDMSRFLITARDLTARDLLPRSPEDLRTQTIRGGK